MKRAPHTPTPRASILDTKRPARAATLERDGTPRLGGFPPKRGKSRTPHCEQHPVRVPYRGHVSVDPSTYILGLTSKGAELTRDLVNRSIVIRILKRARFSFRDFAEGDLLEHI